MSKILEGLNGVICHMDDVLIHGKDGFLPMKQVRFCRSSSFGAPGAIPYRPQDNTKQFFKFVLFNY